MSTGNRAGRQARPVDWSEWAHAREVKLIEAVALSLGIDPHQMRLHPHGWMAAPGAVIADEGDEFDKRLRMAGRALGNELDVVAPVMASSARSSVVLAQFAGWVRDVVRWDAPSELVSLAGPHTDGEVDARPKDGGPEVGATAWTEDKKAEARAMRDRLQTEGVRNYAAQTAAHFGVSPARLREVLALDDKEPAKPAVSPFPIHAFTARRK